MDLQSELIEQNVLQSIDIRPNFPLKQQTKRVILLKH